MKIIKLIEKNQICSLPWLHAEISLQHNDIKPCCKYTANFGQLSNGFHEAWHGQSAQQMRKLMSEAQYTDHCRACSHSDDVFTYKNWKNDLYLNQIKIIADQTTDDIQLPAVFHFLLSNTCNLACRMCSPGLSSKLSDLTRRNEPLQKFLRIMPDTPKIDLENLKGSFSNAKLVTFAGGEPTIDNDCLRIIQMIKSESHSLQVINFSTNMMTVNHKMMAELNSMDTFVLLSISLDGPPHIHEYIRYTADWSTIKNNINIIKTQYPRINFAVNSTISILNVGYVTELLDTISGLGRELNIKFVSFMTSPVIDKKFLHPCLLPDAVKEQYLEKIKNYKNIPAIKYIDKFLPTAQEMLTCTVDSDIEVFKSYISEFDRAAKTDIRTVYPELKQLFI